MRLRPRVERREAADDPRLALGDHQVGIGDDEERRADDGQAQAIEQGREAHVVPVAKGNRTGKGAAAQLPYDEKERIGR